jgi:tricorn protease
VVYQRAGEIWMLASLDAEPVRLDVQLSGDRSGRAPYPVSAKLQLGSFTLGPTGQVVAEDVRGTVHWLSGRDEAAGTLPAEPGVRGRLPVVIPGTDAVACASDRGGEDGLDVIPAEGSAARRIGHGESGRILELAVSSHSRTYRSAVPVRTASSPEVASPPSASAVEPETTSNVDGCHLDHTDHGGEHPFAERLRPTRVRWRRDCQPAANSTSGPSP